MAGQDGLRIGVFGGTFDPPHNGHLALAERCREALELDQVLFVPCGRPALKGRAAVAGGHRLAMVRAALDGRPEFAVSDLELARAGVSYTADTMAELARAQPTARWWLLLGLDALVDFPRWRRPAAILAVAELAVVARPGLARDEVSAALPGWVRARVTWVPMPPLDLASRAIRAELAAGRSVRSLVPAAVADYIAKQRLYRDA